MSSILISSFVTLFAMHLQQNSNLKNLIGGKRLFVWQKFRGDGFRLNRKRDFLVGDVKIEKMKQNKITKKEFFLNVEPLNCAFKFLQFVVREDKDPIYIDETLFCLHI